jgi:quinol-cytochrome oxidoreductase complex cytochrome b subunit
MTRPWIRPLFVVAGVYDLVLGLGYLFLYRWVFNRFSVMLPNHPAYLQLNALFVVVFGLGFLLVARDPERNRDIIRLGVLLKLAYAGIVFTYAALGNMPSMWIPWAVCDLLFAAAFLLALRAIPTGRPARA